MTIDITERENTFLSLLVKGHNDAEIAQATKLTEGTIRVYLHNLYRKIGVKTRTQAAVWYLTKNNPDRRRTKNGVRRG